MLPKKIQVYLTAEEAIDGGAFTSLACRSWHSSMSGGSKRAGCNERHEARPNASIELIGFPLTALEIAKSIAQFVKTLVGRPRQLAMVKGLKRYLLTHQSGARIVSLICAYAAPTATLSHLICFLGDVKRRDEADSPDSAIWMRA